MPKGGNHATVSTTIHKLTTNSKITKRRTLFSAVTVVLVEVVVVNFDWLIPKAKALLPQIEKQRESKYKHFTFLVKGKRILAYGWNDTGKTHPVCVEYGYWNNALHSEVHLYLRIPNLRLLKNAHVVNIHLRRGERVACAAPCPRCQQFLVDRGITSIWYSTDEGIWEKAYIPDLLEIA